MTRRFLPDAPSRRSNRALPIFLMAALTGALLPAPGWAAEPVTLRSALDDVGQYFTAPLRWDGEDWTYFGITAAAVAAAHEFDSTTRRHFATGSKAVLNGQDKNSLRDAAPAVALVAGTFAYAGMLGDSDGYRETWGLLEAGGLSTVTGEALKYAAGRDRPNVTTSPDHWRDGGSSFPSVHAAAAFAIGTVFAESGNDEYRWLRRIVGYGIGAGTSYIRVHDNVHWLSDTVAGAALGIATARFVLNRQGITGHAGLQFQPAGDGWLLSYTVPLQ